MEDSCPNIVLNGLQTFNPSALDSTSFEISLNTFNNLNKFSNTSLTGVTVRRYSAPTVFSTSYSSCNTTAIECTRGNVCYFSCTFNPESSWGPCVAYELYFDPQFNDCKEASEQLQKNIIPVTAPLPEGGIGLNISNVTASDDSFSLRWSVKPKTCASYIKGYTIELLSKSENKSREIEIPLNCTTTTAGEVTFNTSECAGYFNIDTCTSYSVKVKPLLIYTDIATKYSQAVDFYTLPPKDLIFGVYNVNAGSRKFSFNWNLSDPRCANATTNLMLTISDSYTDSTHKIPVQDKYVENGVFKPLDQLITITSFDGSPLSPCTAYEIEVYPQIWNTCWHTSAAEVTANTIPANDLNVNIFGISTDPRRFSFNWNLSDPRCLSATTSLALNITDNFSLQSGYIPSVAKNCTQVGNQNSVSCSVSITSNLTNVLPCTEYKFKIYPKIWGVDYAEFIAQETVQTKPRKDTKVNIRNVISGPTWISFQWDLSEARCMKAMTGVQRKIVDENRKSNSTNLTVGCSGCNHLELNTSSCLMNIKAGIVCPTFKMSPCTQYRIQLYPEIWGVAYTWLYNQTESSTTPDENLHAYVFKNTLSSGSSWISFEWQASTETCRRKIDSYVIKESSSNETYRCLTAGNDIVTFNTSNKCFKKSITPCRDYSFSLILEIGQGSVGIPTAVYATTLNDASVVPHIGSHSQGLDWFSVNWTLSNNRCNKYIDGYTVKLTQFVTNAVKSQTFSRNSCSGNFKGDFFLFNSSCSNASLSIAPCSRYSVSISSKLSINGEKYALSSSSYSHEFATFSGNWGDVENLTVSATYPRALTLEWNEPKCRDAAIIKNYKITITPKWSGALGKENSSELLIPPSCVSKHGNVTGSGRKVSVTVNQTMCNNLRVQLRSCSPYELIVAPVYEEENANKDVKGRKLASRTQPRNEDLSVNLSVKEKGSRWFLLSWHQPNCNLPVLQWTLHEKSLNRSISIPQWCVSNKSTLSFNVSGSTVCGNTPEMAIKPCTEHSFALKLKLSNIADILSAENGTASDTSLAEDPGSVTHVSFYSSAKEAYVNWSLPQDNPECVRGYKIEWKGNTFQQDATSITLKNLEACDNFTVAIVALSDVSSSLNRIAHSVHTQAIDPAPVNASSVLFQFLNDSTSLLSWDKPDDEVDDCITGYAVTYYEKDSNRAVSEQNVEGKNTTSVTLRDQDFQSGKTYVAHIRSKYGLHTQSASVGKTFTWKPSSGVGKIAVAVASCLVIVIMVIVFLILFLKRRRNYQNVPSFAIDLAMIRKPILINDFNQALAFLEADSYYELCKEYEEVKQLSAAHPCNVAKLPENAEKNRYLDILPFDHSRVRLRAVSEPNGIPSDYINASFILGGEKTCYIASQGPKPNTIEHFWQMCLEQDVRVIVALTDLEERGRVKCARYWPTEGVVEYGVVRVELLSTTQEKYFTERRLCITVKDGHISEHVVCQLHFTDWPDYGCPEKPESLIELVYAMRRENAPYSNLGLSPTPIVVHCSAGVGRTGTLIALDLLMKQANECKLVDVMGTTLRIRQDRAKLIQNEDQYRFLYRCLACYINTDLPERD